MNIKKNFLTAFVLGLSLFAFSSAVVFGQTETTRTQFSLYGMHFIGAGQTVNVTVQVPRFTDPQGDIPCVRVRIVFDIYATDPNISNRLRFMRRVSREVDLEFGEAATFDYAAGRNGDYVSPAVFVRLAETDTPELVRVRLLSTLVVRQGERTILNLPAVIRGFDPQPDPPR